MSTDTYDGSRMGRDRPDGVQIGDRIMVVCPDGSGRYYQGVVSHIWDSGGTINAVYNTAGQFSDMSGEYVQATSLAPETPDNTSHVWFDGWFNGNDEWWVTDKEDT